MPDPGEDYQCWSPIADNNGDIDILIDWHEGQARRTVNNSSRSEMAAHAKNRDLLNGSIVTNGLPNVQAFLSGVNYVTIPTGLRAMLKVGGGLTNTGPLTLACDGTDPIEVKLPDRLPCKGGEFTSDHYVDLIYDGTFWIFLYSAGKFAPLDSPVFTGDPQAPTPPDPLDNDHSIATTEWVQNLLFGGEGIVLKVQVFNTAGTFPYIPHAGMKSCIVECIGGGGGGGGAYTAGVAPKLFCGGGGGGGGYSRTLVTSTQVGVSQTVTVGIAGTAGSASGPGTGGTGGKTFFGTVGNELCLANGGSGGFPSSVNQMPGCGLGGAVGIGDIAVAGTPGEGGSFSHDANTAVTFTGNGGPGPFGGGARSVLDAAGGDASAFGAGGAGGAAFSSNPNPMRGGAGSGGLIIVTEFAGRGLTGAQGAQGIPGPVGPIGPTGPTGPGTGDVLHSGTPTDGQLAQWTDASHIKGVDASSLGFAPLVSPIFTGNPQAPTPAATDNDNSIATTAYVHAAVAAGPGTGGEPVEGTGGDNPTAGRLTFVSTTLLKFAPYNGKKIQINGTLYTIPNAGIVGLANAIIFVNGVTGNLAADTVYYVYAFINAGVVTADFRTDGNKHITDVTSDNEGVEVRCSTGTTPDPTRTLIGLIRTNATSQFADSATQRFVRSWFNRECKTFSNTFTADRSTSSTSMVELNTEIRTELVVFANEIVTVYLGGYAFNSTPGYAFTAVGWDGTRSGTGSNYLSAAFGTGGSAVAATEAKSLTEGYHYVTFMGASGSGTASFGSTPVFCSLNGSV